MQLNRGVLIKKGANKTYQVTGTVAGGVEYVLGLKNGRVGQFYPVKK